MTAERAKAFPDEERSGVVELPCEDTVVTGAGRKLQRERARVRAVAEARIREALDTQGHHTERLRAKSRGTREVLELLQRGDLWPRDLELILDSWCNAAQPEGAAP